MKIKEILTESKDFTNYIEKQGNKFFVDREDEGRQITKPGDKISFMYKGKRISATVSNRAYGRDNDTYELNLLEAKRVDKLDPETEKKLEETLTKLNKIADMSEAKKIAHEFLNSMKFQEKTEKYKRLVDKARSVKEVIKFVYDVKLAGEGLGVIK